MISERPEVQQMWGIKKKKWHQGKRFCLLLEINLEGGKMWKYFSLSQLIKPCPMEQYLLIRISMGCI